MPKARLISAALVSVALLSACAQIPQRSQVQTGPNLNSVSANETINYSPAEPLDGQTEKETVTGHITAGTGPQNDYSTARNYLTQKFRAKWTPSDEVLVQYGPLQVLVGSDHQVEVRLKIQAYVDSNGYLHSLDTPEDRTLKYQLTKENGNWRISDGPNLTIVNKPVFDVLFTGYSIYFFDNAHQYLVPELRWFPVRASTGTRLVNALLAGPSKWLEKAVATSLPNDVKLAIQSVAIADGVAHIDLNSKAVAASTMQLRYFVAQLEATLRQLDTVTSVELSIDGNVRSLGALSYLQPAELNPNPIALTKNGLKYLNPGTTSVAGSQALVKTTEATDFAIEVNNRDIVLKSSKGTFWGRLGQIDRTVTRVDERSNALNPVFDTSGLIWSLSRSRGSSVHLLTSTGLKTKVDARWLADYNVDSFSLSPEGSRAALVVHNGLTSKLLVSAVIRTATGLPIELGEPYEIT
ncbi:MAG: hypothetical protein RL556_82, partial [Actinomycetota bacterium]